MGGPLKKADLRDMEASLRRSHRAWEKKILAERKRTRGIDEETSSVGFGPVTLDVAMARLHGWSEEAIRRAHDVLAACARKEGSYAHRRHPDRYFTAPDGTTIFVGDLSPAARRKIERSYRRPPRRTVQST